MRLAELERCPEIRSEIATRRQGESRDTSAYSTSETAEPTGARRPLGEDVNRCQTRAEPDTHRLRLDKSFHDLHDRLDDALRSSSVDLADDV